MRHIRYYISVVVTACSVAAGCANTSSANAIFADSIAEAANAGLPMLIDEYRRQGNQIIDEASDRHTAEAKLAELQQKWEKVWKAWESFRVAHNTFIEIVQSDGDAVAYLSALRNSYCGLLDVWPESIPATPIAGVECNTINIPSNYHEQ